MEDTGYNGWTNRETWLVSLWQDNERGSYEWARDRARELVEDWVENGGRQPEFILANQMREEYEEGNALGDGASIWTDLLGTSLSRVNWNEIAYSLCAEVRENA